MRANTVFGSKLKLERFVMLLWNFTERGKSYQQISNAANLPPQAHYVEDKLSPNSIANFIIILLSHFHFCHIKICFRYRNSNASSKSPGDGGRGLGRHELNCFADNSFVNQNVNKFSVFFVNQMVYYIFAGTPTMKKLNRRSVLWPQRTNAVSASLIARRPPNSRRRTVSMGFWILCGTTLR